MALFIGHAAMTTGFSLNAVQEVRRQRGEPAADGGVQAAEGLLQVGRRRGSTVGRVEFDVAHEMTDVSGSWTGAAILAGRPSACNTDECALVWMQAL